ncbi:cytochrome [Sesamum alatum]|uniref:Cytochrome n=1 Tax=Sesamum alatum TaxID=300844 RepID=A0AAE1YR28_9LAMI|nr:cytochrome [Sesamum alatum]
MHLTLVFFLYSFLILLAYYFLHKIIWVPLKIQKHFAKQGVRGPGYRPVVGNTVEIRQLLKAEAELQPTSSITHDVAHRIAPHYSKWSKLYGKNFLYWFGAKPVLAVADPDMIKEVLMNTSNGRYRRLKLDPLSKQLFGDGLVTLEGEKWAVHRRITGQAFNMERVKGWIPEIVATTERSLNKWEEKRAEKSEFELDVHQELQELSADIISRTAFGSSYEEGKRIFDLQDQQTSLILQAYLSVYIPGFRFLPTKKNRLRWKLDREIHESIRSLIEKSSKSIENRHALLALLMSPYSNEDGVEERLDIDEIIDECKTFYFAGKETTANHLSWVLLLLAQHQDWQTRARDEVLATCGSKTRPSADHLSNFKLMSMIFNETLRLYPVAVELSRETLQNVKLGNLELPVDTQVYLPMTAVHHDTAIWGDDADNFNPLRFAEPRRHLASAFPFGLGPRICVGQNFAIAEAKIILAMILQQYSFVISPSYVHAPLRSVTLQPQYGLQLLFSRLLH